MNCFWTKDMLGGCACGVVAEDRQEAGGQQAQVGSLRAGERGVLKMSPKGRVIGFRRRWKALLWLLGLLWVGSRHASVESYLGKKATMNIARKIRVFLRFVSKGINVRSNVAGQMLI